MGIAAVLFDTDGTLVDTDEHWHAAEVATFEYYGHDWSAEDHAACEDFKTGVRAAPGSWAHCIGDSTPCARPGTWRGCRLRV